MPEPFNYSLRNAVNPADMLINSLQIAGQADKLKADRTAATQAQEAVTQAQELQKQMQLDLGMVGANPTTAGISKLMVKYPALSEDFKRTYDALDAGEQKSRISQASDVYAALEAGKPEVAVKSLTDYAEAYRNSNRGDEAKTLEDLAKLIEMSPETAKTSAGLFLSSSMGPEKFAETFTKLQTDRRNAELQPALFTKAQAEAEKASTESQFAESKAVSDLEKQGWDIWKIKQDASIAKQNNKIAAMNAALGKETNELKKHELKLQIEEKKRARDADLREKTTEVSTLRTGIDNSLRVIDRLVANPELDNILGSVEGSSFYPSTLVGLISPFSDADKRADAMSDLETVGSQAFLNNLMAAKEKGATFGSLTEKEGDRLTNYITNLGAKQSEKQFKENMKEVQRLLLKSRENISTKYGVPDDIPDTPDVEVSPEEIDAILKRYQRPLTGAAK